MHKRPYNDLRPSMNASVLSKRHSGLPDEICSQAMDLMVQERDQESALNLGKENPDSGSKETIPLCTAPTSVHGKQRILAIRPVAAVSEPSSEHISVPRPFTPNTTSAEPCITPTVSDTPTDPIPSHASFPGPGALYGLLKTLNTGSCVTQTSETQHKSSQTRSHATDPALSETGSGAYSVSLAATKTLVQGSNERVVYAGGSGPAVLGFAENFKGLDGNFMPVRDVNGVLRIKENKRLGAVHLMIADPELMAFPYPDTHPEGVLTVLPGWDHRTARADFAYRYDTMHTHFDVSVPCLNGARATVRHYKCKGVKVCVDLDPAKKRERHFHVAPTDESMLDTLDTTSSIADDARKKVRNLARGVLTRRRFCPAQHFNPASGTYSPCDGVPRVVKLSSHGFGKKPFLGCSKYQPTAPGQCKHYAAKLVYDTDMLQYLEDLLTRRLPLAGPVEVNSTCKFVQMKKKSKMVCPVNGSGLEEISCSEHPGGTDPHHIAITIEPHFNAGVPRHKKLLYVVCFNSHTHPPPPPPAVTLRKIRLVDHFYAKYPKKTVSQLRQDVMTYMRTNGAGGMGDGSDEAVYDAFFQGNFEIPDSMVKRRISALRPPVSRMASEVGALCLMVADSSKPYVRRMRMAEGAHVFTLGNDAMLAHASFSKSFAGDATFKTVTESTRKVMDGRWYLYNIIAPATPERLNNVNVVVYRALMSSLSKAAYEAVFDCFLEELAEAGERTPGTGCIRVPYIPVSNATEARAVMASSFTVDFDSAEALGYCASLSRATGGTPELHMENGMVGCDVHLKRDIRRRSDRADILCASGLSSTADLRKKYMRYVDAPDAEEANAALNEIKRFDEQWVRWVKSSKMEPMICMSMSKMSTESRTLGFSDTNGVESHNRRGNLLVGKHNAPQDLAEKLEAVDLNDLKLLKDKAHEYFSVACAYRVNRSDSTLRPCTSNNTGVVRRRSPSGVGPTPRRTRRRTSTEARGCAGVMRGRGRGRGRGREGVSEQQTTPEHDPASAEAIILLESKLLKVSQDIEWMPAESVEVREKRTDVILNVIGQLHGCSCDLAKAKEFVFNGVLQAHVDREFRKHLFKFYREDVVPLVAANSKDGDEQVKTQVTTEVVNAASSTLPQPNSETGPRSQQ